MEAGITATWPDHLLQPNIPTQSHLARAWSWVRPGSGPKRDRECSCGALQWKLQAMA